MEPTTTKVRTGWARARTTSRAFPGVVLRPTLAKRGGYPVVKLRRPPRTVPVHVPVLEAFVGPRPPGQEALHGDGQPTHVTVR